MLGAYQAFVESQLEEIRGAGLWKPERVLHSAQRPDAELQGGDKVLVLCANNYLGLADDPRIIGTVRDGKLAAARLYMEDVEAAGRGIDTAVRRLTGRR